MPDPFALNTQDPRWSAGDPVTVNGYLYLPADAVRPAVAQPDYAALGFGSAEAEGRN